MLFYISYWILNDGNVILLVRKLQLHIEIDDSAAFGKSNDYKFLALFNSSAIVCGSVICLYLFASIVSLSFVRVHAVASYFTVFAISFFILFYSDLFYFILFYSILDFHFISLLHFQTH